MGNNSLPLNGKDAAEMIMISKHQPGNRDLVYELVEPFVFEIDVRLFCRFEGIGCQQALIKRMFRREHRFASQKNVKKFQRFDIASDHQQADW